MPNRQTVPTRQWKGVTRPDGAQHRRCPCGRMQELNSLESALSNQTSSVDCNVQSVGTSHSGRRGRSCRPVLVNLEMPRRAVPPEPIPSGFPRLCCAAGPLIGPSGRCHAVGSAARCSVCKRLQSPASNASEARNSGIPSVAELPTRSRLSHGRSMENRTPDRLGNAGSSPACVLEMR